MKTAKEYINLLPRKEKKPLRLISVWSAGAALFLLVWTVVFGLKARQLQDLKAHLGSLADQKQHLEQELAVIRKELGLTSAASANPENAALIQSLLKERVLWSQVFEQFSRIIPRGVWFDSLEGSSTGTAEVRIRGGAFDYRLVSDFMLGMERSGYFEKPELLFAQKAMVQGHDVIEFEIRCGVKKTQGAT